MIDEYFKTVRSVFDVLRAEKVDNETVFDTLGRLTRESAAHRASMSRPEPAPQNAEGPALWPMIIAELEDRAKTSHSERVLLAVAQDARERHEFGLAKYGVPLVAKNGRDPLKDAYQESLDAAVYMRAAYELGMVPRWRSCSQLDRAINIRQMIMDRDGA